MAKDKIFGKETVSSMNEVRDTASEIASILEQFDVSQLSDGMQNIAQMSKDQAEHLSESMQYSEENKNLANLSTPICLFISQKKETETSFSWNRN